MNNTEKSIFFYIACIFDFAEKNNLSIKESYIYLNKYNGIQYLIDNYEIEHTLSKEDTLQALSNITIKGGGYLK